MTTRALCGLAIIWVSLSAAEGADGPSFPLVGTIRGPEGGIAICVDPTTAQTFPLRVGQKFDGWELLSVQAERAVFAKEGSSTQAVIHIESFATGVARVPSAPPQAGPLPPPPPSAVPKGKWVDGDGQIIGPPKH